MQELIPETAHELIQETWADGTRKSAFYELAGQWIGYRSWSESGQRNMEYGIKDGVMHGPFRTWHDNGQLNEEAVYEFGKEHGISKQYDETGALLGSYSMHHGTGRDIWFSHQEIIAEERWYQDGKLHGYERWWNDDRQTVVEESHFQHGQEHGIFRQWNSAGRLRRGYPKYFIAGQQVSKREYQRAQLSDPSLPPLLANDNAPQRESSEPGTNG